MQGGQVHAHGAREPRRGSPRRTEDRLARRGGAIEFLRLPAFAFGVVSGLRSVGYDTGLFAARRAAVPVFSLGNLSVGGTGKTPAVVWLARELARRGRRPGVLSRGYGAVEGGANDEARMLERLLPGVPHVARADRVAGARLLCESGAASPGAQRGGAPAPDSRAVDAIVLDDGFQHRRLARDLDLVLVDALRPWGLARDERGESVRALLPRGLLREPPTALSRADALIVTRSDQIDAAWLERLEAQLEGFAPGVPRARARHAPRGLVRADGAREELSALARGEFELVSGIGNPDAFARTVRSLGAQVREERRFADHHAFTREDLAGLGAGGRRILCTAKDLPKLAALGVPCVALEIELEILSGGAALEACIDAVLDARVAAVRQERRP